MADRRVATVLQQEQAWSPGKRIGAYQLLAKIGSGGMGTVYRAYHQGLAQYFAIKFLAGGQQQSIERFQREARIMAQLRHPNIVIIHDIGKVAGHYYIVMDYIQGQSLSQVIKSGTLNLITSLKLIQTIAGALQTTHSKGIIHRDIKPSNILIRTADQQPYIIDFGLADMDEQTPLTQQGQVMGTPGYMAPEQVQAQQVDARSDIYSLGAVMYELLTGHKVVQAQSPLQALWQVVHQEVTPPRELCRRIPRTVEGIVIQCLAKDPAQRYQTMGALARDIERYLQGRKTLVRSTQRRLAATSSSKRPRSILVGSVVCLLLGLSTLWLLGTQGRPSNRVPAARRSLPDRPPEPERPPEPSSGKPEVAARVMPVQLKPRSPHPQHWPLALWQACWNGHWVDFTHQSWKALSVQQQMRYATAYQRWYAATRGVKVYQNIKVGGTELSMVLIPPGRFWMGTAEKPELGGPAPMTRHQVLLAQPFAIQKTELTQAQWYDITKQGHYHPSMKLFPKHMVSWREIKAQLLPCLPPGWDLPTEEQWEYACRAGTLSRFFWGDDSLYMDRYANIADQALGQDIAYVRFRCQRLKHQILRTELKRQLHTLNDGFVRLAPVGSLQPNAFGLHDMLGNVCEFTRNLCRDFQGITFLVLRGGGWCHLIRNVHCAMRRKMYKFYYKDADIGFRLVCSAAIFCQAGRRER